MAQRLSLTNSLHAQETTYIFSLPLLPTALIRIPRCISSLVKYTNHWNIELSGTDFRHNGRVATEYKNGSGFELHDREALHYRDAVGDVFFIET